jgi:hypothetical protein
MSGWNAALEKVNVVDPFLVGFFNQCSELYGQKLVTKKIDCKNISTDPNNLVLVFRIVWVWRLNYFAVVSRV